MQYDSSVKCISPELSADIATLVLGRKPDLKQISESLPSDERRVDFLAKMTGDEESILHIEFQTRYDPDMPVRMLAYHARIMDRYRLPVYPIVVYLTQTDRPIETAYSSHVGNKHIFTFNYDVIKVWELKSKTVFKNKLYGLYALTPLMPDADLAECRGNLIEAVEHNLISASSYMCMATFARLKYPKDVVKNMIEDKLLKQSPFYGDVLEEGRDEGAEETIIAVLAARFGSVSARISERIHNLREKNSAMLDELIQLVATAKDIGEFERKLDKMM
ncbi:MAG: Rpn family recombination-promoting nuclease/putative transposase [Methanosarcinales archaeon]|nr:Rpn family recombination-promoting nuclease/putative transposase [Methanosarcinales archaeon]